MSRHVVALLAVLVLACSGASHPRVESAGGGEQGVVTYVIGPYAPQLYPNASWLPSAYTAMYPSTSAAIIHFTQQSLMRDGFTGTRVTTNGNQVSIVGTDPAIGGYSQMHPAFLDQAHAYQGLLGVTNCQNASGCWCTDPNGCYSSPPPAYPWALFLPLGMPMVNQHAVLFLDYPPASSLTVQTDFDGEYGDYLANFTMNRFTSVMQNAGAANPVLYETIVDSRPVAAPGSHLTMSLPDPVQFFDSPGNLYIVPMLELLTNPPSNPTTANTLPVAVLGTPAREAWAHIIDPSNPSPPVPHVGQVGVSSLTPGAPQTPWIAGNHPDVTSYQCCQGDQATQCCDAPAGQSCTDHPSDWSWSLLSDETHDFVDACFLQMLGADPTFDVNSALSACTTQWTYPPPAQSDALAFCVQAKLDDQDPAARCANATQAAQWCGNHGNNPCASADCAVAAAPAG